MYVQLIKFCIIPVLNRSYLLASQLMSMFTISIMLFLNNEKPLVSSFFFFLVTTSIGATINVHFTGMYFLVNSPIILISINTDYQRKILNYTLVLSCWSSPSPPLSFYKNNNFISIFQYSGHLILYDGAISHNWPQITSDHTIWGKSHNS